MDAINAGTIRIKLPVREQISCIEVEARAVVNKEDYDESIIDTLTKIEVIGDGSSVLYSAVPETAAFLHLTQIRSTPNCERRNYEGLWDIYRVKLCFGRWQRDERYLLDTSVYNNVYLEIPWVLDTDAFKTHTFTYTIRYLRPIERVPAEGFIRSRDIEYDQHAWTATGHYFVDLPLKYPWYMLGCRIYDIDQDLVNDIPHIKLDIDDGRLVLVDDDTDDLITINNERLPYPVHVPHIIDDRNTAALGYIRSYLGRTEEVNLTVYGAAGIDPQLDPTGSGLSGLIGQRIAYKLIKSAGTGLISGLVNASMWGSAYMCCLIIKDWYQDWFEPTPHEPFPVGEHSEADIDYTHGAYTVTDLRTFLQEICPAHI